MITDLTKEHPNKTLWRFLLPMLFSVMFQQIYNIADSMIAGRFAGENALAAVGASYPITIIFMAFAVGMNLGASVVVSRLFGAEDRGGVKRAVTTAFLSSMVLGIILTLFGYFFNHQMMRWIRTPQNIMADGVLYLKIYIFGIIFLMLYNVCTGVFTALGDSKTPLYFLLGSSVGNIILDYIFVAKFQWGVSGVAWAAQNIGAGKKERIPLGFRTGVKLSELTALPFVILYFIFSRQMMGLFLGAESVEAISAGMAFLKIVSPWYFMIVIKLMTDGIIRGSGAMVYFVVATVPDLILRIGFALVLTKSFGSTGIWMAWPFGWIVATTLTLIFYRKLGYKNDKSSDF